MNQKHSHIIEQLQKKRNKKKIRENVSVFSVLIALFILVYYMEKNYKNDLLYMPMFFIAGSMCLYTAIKNIIKQYQVKKWIVSDCTIIKKEIIQKHGLINNFMVQSVVPIVYFSYNINGKEFLSDLVHIGIKTSTNEKKWNPISEKYHAGLNCKCYINPKKYDQSVLESFIDWEYFKFYFSFILFFWGVIVYYFFFMR